MEKLDNKAFKIKASKFFQIKEIPLLLVISIAVISLSIVKPNFLIFGNIHSVFLGASFEAIMAIGMTLLLVLGGFDLSVGSVAGFSGVMVGTCFDMGLNVPFSILIGLFAATLVGLTNGYIVAKLKVNSMITTLAMQMIVRGLIYIMTKGVGKPNFPDSFNIIARQTFFNIQTPIYISVILIAIFGVLFAKTGWFRQFYFIGGNEEAARLSGIKVDRLRIMAYAFTSFMAGLSGILLAARMGGAIPTQGQNMEMNVIAGCVIGGCSVVGGEGTMFGSFLGILVMALVVNAFNLLGVDIYWQRTILGIILLIAVLADVFRRRKLD